jgi:hypothetical protein
LAVSKLVAGREKDLAFLSALLRHRLILMENMRARLAATALTPERRDLCMARLKRLDSQCPKSP